MLRISKSLITLALKAWAMAFALTALAAILQAAQIVNIAGLVYPTLVVLALVFMVLLCAFFVSSVLGWVGIIQDTEA